MSKFLWTLLACGAAAGAVASTAANAQQRPREAPPRRAAAVAPSDAVAGAKSLDHVLVSCLMTENQGGIALARIAQQRATTKEVKAFAEQMVRDHSQFVSKLQAVSTADRKDVPRTLPERRQPLDDTGGTKTNDADDPRERLGGDAQRPNRADPGQRPAPGLAEKDADDARGAAGKTATVGALMQIKDELAQRCLASAQRELEQKSGEEFDKCYIGMQIAAHMKMADTLAVFQRHASGELKETLGECEQTTKEHLAKAKEIIKSLDDSGRSDPAKRTDEAARE
jgi:predicted outer membrane protein